MNKIRVAAAATTLSLVGSLTALGGAGASPTAVGTTEASTKVLRVALGATGELLDVRLLDDVARSTTDPKVLATPEAFSRLTALGVTSAVAGLNKSIPETPWESRTPGGKSSDGSGSVGLGSALPAALASGTLGAANLTSAVDGAGARSAMTSNITDLSLVGQLVSVKGLSSALGAGSASTDATGTRSVKLDSIDVLNLGALLKGLGIPLTALLPSQVTGLLGALGGTVPGVGDAAALNTLIDGIQSQVASLNATLPAPSAMSSGTIGGIVDTLGLGSAIPSSTVDSIAAIGDPAAQVNALVDQLQDALAKVLSDTLGVLDDLSLLKLGATEVGIRTKAADTVDHSVAEVIGNVGNVTVGGITLPGVDLGSTASQLTALTNRVNDTVKGALSAVSPDLAGLVNVSVLSQDKSVTTSGGYTHSRAGVTALAASIVPPANLSALVTSITGQAGSVASLITAAGAPVPVVGSAMGTLNSTLGSAVNALAGGATLKVAEVLGSSDYAIQGSPEPAGTLPRTGRDNLPLVALSMLLIALGLWFRSAVVMPLRSS